MTKIHVDADGNPTSSAGCDCSSTAYEEGRALGEMMRDQRENGDSSYDCRWDLADAAKKPGDYFTEYRRGLDAGLAGTS